MDNKVKFTLSWFDYILFFQTLALSTAVGIHFGIRDRHRDKKNDYLLGGKRMQVLPIAISLIASQISGITLLAVPGDVYKFGSNYIWLCLAIPIVCFINHHAFLPLFFQLQLTSIYEYLNLRFDKKVQSLASFLFILSVFLHNPIVIYIPALIFTQVTGFDLHWTICVVSIVCVFYTTIGGFKAVVWTDALQFVGMVVSIVVVLVLGTRTVGGFKNVIKEASTGRRLNIFDFNLDPTVRDGFWPVVVGGSAQYMSYICFNQGYLQKYLALPTLRKARRALWIYCLGVTGIIAASVFTGNILYTRYSHCDPLANKEVSRSDQILPYFVMEISKNFLGLMGLFIAGILSAALSTLSATLNTIAAATYEDFILPYTNYFEKTNKENLILKVIVVSSGLLCTVLAMFVDRMGGILSFSIALNSIAGGPMLGLFVLGTVFPSSNSKGAFYGCISGIVFLTSVVIGNQWCSNQGLIENFSLPTSTDRCDFLHPNITHSISKKYYASPAPMLYKISFWYNTVMGLFVVIIMGLIISRLTKEDNFITERRLLYNFKSTSVQ
ncbi:hypothetical protein FQA39_LY01686 [Lamprigera yunnana]|nr:hypothetical protein FQA39_LY01686 [Lamprigera yunnana]